MDPVGLGRSIRALRRRRRWRQSDLARAAGISQTLVSRIERGHVVATSVGTLERLATVLEARFTARIEWNGEGLARLLDEAHAQAVEHVVRTLARLGWECAPEATFAVGGERGSVDVLALHPETGTVLVIEVKTLIPDLQAMLSALDRKARLGHRIARERGWHARVVGRLLVVVESSTARRRVEAHAGTFAAQLPHRGRDVHRYLRAPGEWNGGALGGLWFLSLSTGATTRHRVSTRTRPIPMPARSRTDARPGVTPPPSRRSAIWRAGGREESPGC